MNRYTRVIPRDLFNEGNLLKCMGQLTLHLMDRGVDFADSYSGGPFEIVQDCDGRLSIAGLALCLQGREFTFWRPLNSRQPWPLWAEQPDDPDFEPVPVFDNAGNFSREMEGLLK